MFPDQLLAWRDTSATLELAPLQLAFILQACQLLATLYSTDDDTQAFIDDIVSIIQAQ